MLLVPFLYLFGGAMAGYVLHRVAGCRSGACLITSNPYISMLYGMMVGFFLYRG
jgi:hypothetical protein